MSYDFLSFSEKGKGKGVNLPNLPEWFQYIFFFIFWGRDRGLLLVSLLLLFLISFFQFRYPLDMYLILSVVLSTLCTIFSSIEKILRKNKRN